MDKEKETGFKVIADLKNHYAVTRLDEGKLWIREVDRLVEYSGINKRTQEPYTTRFHTLKGGWQLAEDSRGFVKVLHLELDHIPDENFATVLEQHVRSALREWVI